MSKHLITLQKQFNSRQWQITGLPLGLVYVPLFSSYHVSLLVAEKNRLTAQVKNISLAGNFTWKVQPVSPTLTSNQFKLGIYDPIHGPEVEIGYKDIFGSKTYRRILPRKIVYDPNREDRQDYYSLEAFDREIGQRVAFPFSCLCEWSDF